jgi:3-hydroxyacyl-[acyl-carrier-protein] dehydratase
MKNILLDHFYEEISSTFSAENSQSFSCLIRLNAAHPIYKGHFAQVPIAPGVCLTQIIKEVLMHKFQKELFMSAGDNIKFLSMINPSEAPELELSFSIKIHPDTLEVNANYSNKGTICMKFKGRFNFVE